ncbi:MAG: O-antigen ligase family protein [Planctomycetota bacterium]|nr:O-antigen ligase family protein [Planctomycetota bacterium]
MPSREKDRFLALIDGMMLVGLVAAIVLRILAPGVSTSFHAPSVNLFIATLPLLLLSLSALRPLLRGQDRLTLWTPAAPALLFLAWAALSAGLAGNSAVAIETWTDWTGALLLAYVLFLEARDPRRRSALLDAFIVIGGVVAALALEDVLVERPVAQKLVADDPGIVPIPEELRPEFQSRLRSGEVFGPFLLSNLLAGYLIVVIPITLGTFLDHWRGRRSSTSGVRVAMLVVFLLLEFTCLAMTGSKGAWVAIAMAAVPFVVLVRQRRPGRIGDGWLAMCALVGLLLASGWAAGFSPVQRLGGTSMEVRDEYFRATRSMIADHPILGVGTGNFREYYPAYRPATAEETKFAHNNYLQVAAETGWIGILLLLLFLAFLLKGLHGGEEPDPQPPGRRDLILAFFGGVGGILALSSFTALDVRFSDGISQVFLIVAWGIFFIPFSWRGKESATPGGSKGLRAGAWAAAVAAGLHWTVDFDLYSAGLLFSTIAAILLAVPQPARGLRISYSARLLLVLCGMVPATAIYVFYLPRMLFHDVEFSQAEDEFWSASGEETDAREAALGAAEELYRRAALEKPWGGRALLQRGRVLLALYRLRAEAGRPQPEFLDSAIASLEEAALWLPRLAEIRYELAIAYSVQAKDRPESFDVAERYLEEAVDLYPTKPRYRHQLARFLFHTRYHAQQDQQALERATTEAGLALLHHGQTRHARLRLPAEAIEECRAIQQAWIDR